MPNYLFGSILKIVYLITVTRVDKPFYLKFHLCVYYIIDGCNYIEMQSIVLLFRSLCPVFYLHMYSSCSAAQHGQGLMQILKRYHTVNCSVVTLIIGNSLFLNLDVSNWFSVELSFTTGYSSGLISKSR